jgi:hypothetical protein
MELGPIGIGNFVAETLSKQELEKRIGSPLKAANF